MLTALTFQHRLWMIWQAELAPASQDMKPMWRVLAAQVRPICHIDSWGILPTVTNVVTVGLVEHEPPSCDSHHTHHVLNLFPNGMAFLAR